MIAALVTAASLLGFMALSFAQSLPTWCANPNGDGNWIVIALGFCA